MKKNIFLTAALLMGLSFASVMLTSCDKEDNKASETPKKDTTPASVQMNFTFEATQDMLDYCDMVVKYDDGTGMKTETANALEWTKSLKVSLPATLTFIREVSLKSGVEASDIASFSYLKGYRYGYVMMNAQGEQLGSLGSRSNISRHNVTRPEGIPTVIEMINAGRLNDSVTYSFDKNGSLVD